MADTILQLDCGEKVEMVRLSGYPSIDKPWLKYYSEEAINMKLPQKTMYEYAWENNKNHPKDIVFSYYRKKTTYEQFFDNVRNAVKALHFKGIKKGDIVTVMSMHTPETIYLIYALNYLGAVSNMVYMTLSENEVLHTITNTESKLFFVLEPAIPTIEKIRDEIKIPVVVMPISDSMPVHIRTLYRIKNRTNKHYDIYKAFINSGLRNDLPPMETDHEALATIVYTSGTTGEPKGVMLSNDGLNALVSQDVHGIIVFRRKLKYLFMLPPFTGYGFALLHVGISAGLELQLQIDLNPNKVADALFKNKTECFCAGPAFVDAILNHSASNLDRLEYFICGGGEISKDKEMEINRFLRDCKAKATYSNGYGMTEACSVLCTNCNQISKISSLGIPFVKTTIKVVDTETGEELTYRKQGELLFNTPALMVGYYKNDEATEKTIIRDRDGKLWLRTGDIGYVDEDGFVFMSGRLKRIYYVRAGIGEICRLFPSHIEEVIEKSEFVTNCAVIVREDNEKISVPIAYVTLSEKAKVCETEKIIEELHKLTKRDLPDHMQLFDIIVLNDMPITQSGKIDYRMLEYKE